MWQSDFTHWRLATGADTSPSTQPATTNPKTNPENPNPWVHKVPMSRDITLSG